MNQGNIARQQIGQAVARNGVGVTAAEFHETVFAVCLDFAADRLGQSSSNVAIAEFADVTHQ